jgi:predicted Zn-dependent protease
MLVSAGAQIAQLKLENSENNNILLLDLSTETNGNNKNIVLNNIATINPNSLTNNILAKTGLNNNIDDAAQSYIEKIPQPLTTAQLDERDYQNALNLIQTNHWSAAVNLLQTILARTADNVPARTALITLLLKQKRLLEAKQVVQAGLALQPEQPAFIKLAAQILLAQGQPANALKILKTATPALNSDPSYYALMAALYQRLGYSLKAAQIYNELVSLDTNNAIWWLGLGTALETAGKNKAALEAYQNANVTGNLSPQLQSYVSARIHALGE